MAVKSSFNLPIQRKSVANDFENSHAKIQKIFNYEVKLLKRVENIGQGKQIYEQFNFSSVRLCVWESVDLEDNLPIHCELLVLRTKEVVVPMGQAVHELVAELAGLKNPLRQLQHLPSRISLPAPHQSVK